MEVTGGLAGGQSLSSIQLALADESCVSAALVHENAIVPSDAVIKDPSDNSVDLSGNYNITYAKGSLTVNKIRAKVHTPPEAGSNLEYTGASLELVGGGSADSSIEYAFGTGTTTEPTTGWSDAIPSKIDAGTYFVWYRAKANDNYTASDAGVLTVEIGKAPLTVTAKNKTIVYGDAPANDGVEYSGFANSETESALSGTLDYDYSYTQYGDVGSYTITPKGLTSGNYDINFTTSGTLTVEPKEVGLAWNSTSLTFNGSAQAPTAEATGTVNSDAISVTVTGAQTNAGTGYTATASALTGGKAGNYKLPDEKTTGFSISRASARAIEDVAKNLGYDMTSLTASVAGKMPENAGTLTYMAGTATTTGNVTVSDFAVDNSGAVAASLSGGEVGNVITLPVTIASTNYADAKVNVVITLIARGDAEVGITGVPVSAKTYGDADFTLTGSVTNAGDGTGAWTWSTSDTTVFQIASNGATATVKILKAGSATISASYESDTTIGILPGQRPRR